MVNTRKLEIVFHFYDKFISLFQVHQIVFRYFFFYIHLICLEKRNKLIIKLLLASFLVSLYQVTIDWEVTLVSAPKLFRPYLLNIVRGIFCRYDLFLFNQVAMSIWSEGFIIDEGALVCIVVVEDIWYLRDWAECYFSYNCLFIFNAEGFEDLYAFLVTFRYNSYVIVEELLYFSRCEFITMRCSYTSFDGTRIGDVVCETTREGRSCTPNVGIGESYVVPETFPKWSCEF